MKTLYRIPADPKNIEKWQCLAHYSNERSDNVRRNSRFYRALRKMAKKQLRGFDKIFTKIDREWDREFDEVWGALTPTPPPPYLDVEVLTPTDLGWDKIFEEVEKKPLLPTPPPEYISLEIFTDEEISQEISLQSPDKALEDVFWESEPGAFESDYYRRAS